MELIDKNVLMNSIQHLYDTAILPDTKLHYAILMQLVKDQEVITSSDIGISHTTSTGEWIECNYRFLEHGFLETIPNDGLFCSNCRAVFQKKNMIYKQYCPACGSKMTLHYK